MKIAILSTLFFLIAIRIATAQTDRFNAGVVGGLNFSALAGEDLTDFFGVNVGIIGTAKLSKHYQLGIEFLFSQNGEYLLPDFYPRVTYDKIRLNHLEIPLHINGIVDILKKSKAHTVNFNAGIAYVRLLDHFAQDLTKKDISEQILYTKRDAFVIQTGMTYFFIPQLGINLKATLPIKVEDWTIATRLVYLLG